MRNDSLSIGDLATRTGCKVPTIRYYENIGLLETVERTTGGHRVYEEADVRRLVFIRKSRELGFSSNAIRSLLAFAAKTDRPCAEVDVLAAEHLVEITEKIHLLSAMGAALRQMLDGCHRTTIHECRVIESLSQAPAADMG